jgi:hypothetical protein
MLVACPPRGNLGRHETALCLLGLGVGKMVVDLWKRGKTEFAHTSGQIT